MDSNPRPPPDDGPSDPNPNPRPEPDPEPKPQESTVEERLSSLTVENSGSAAGCRLPAGNGFLPADFCASDEIEEEEPPFASCSADEIDGAAGEAWGSSSHGGVSWRESSEQDEDAPPSPGSSGYAGERGSSGESGMEEVDDGGASQDDCSRRKDHRDEDDASVSWRKRKKHFFVLSHSGKPIYSRYGDEHKLAGFSATLQAIISFVENSGDHVKLVRAGNHQVVFLVKGPIYLVCISCTEEPYEALRGQLGLIYSQMLLILTKSVHRCFEKNPKFDMTSLLGGTNAVFSSLIHSFSWNPATFLHAYTCLPLAYGTRQAAGAILQDVADSGVLFAILMSKHKVDAYLTLLTTSSDAFYHLKDCRIRIEAVLVKSNVLCEVKRSMLDSGLHVEDLPVDSSLRSGSLSPHLDLDKMSAGSLSSRIGTGGPAGLWHFMYKSIYLDQYVSSEFSSPINNSNQQKRLYRAYQKLYNSMHDKGTGPHKTQFRRDVNCVLLCWITQDFELYAAFDPLADKAQAIKVCNRVCQWIRDSENEIFLLGASPFSW